RPQAPAAVECGGGQPATDDPTPVVHSSQPGADVVARAPDASGPSPRPVADPVELNASLPRVGGILSRQPHVRPSEPVTSRPAPEPLPLTVRHVVTPRSEEAGRSIDRSNDPAARPVSATPQVADVRQAEGARDAVQPVVRRPERAAAPDDLRRASL